MKQKIKEFLGELLIAFLALILLGSVILTVGYTFGYAWNAGTREARGEQEAQAKPDNQCHKVPMTFEVEQGWGQHRYIVTFWAFALTKMQCSGNIDITGCVATERGEWGKLEGAEQLVEKLGK